MEGVQGFSEDIVLVFQIVTIRKGCVKNCLKLRDVINRRPLKRLSIVPWRNSLPYLSLKPVDESTRVLELCDKKKEEK
jgi:hypothetical protein